MGWPRPWWVWPHTFHCVCQTWAEVGSSPRGSPRPEVALDGLHSPRGVSASTAFPSTAHGCRREGHLLHTQNRKKNFITWHVPCYPHEAWCILLFSP